MPITLYIDYERCTSMEQLRSYFKDSLSYDSSIFYDLLDCARSGDMSKWLREKGESGLADKVDGIDGDLGDSEYFSRLSALMTGKETACDSFEKPDFSKCFQVEEVHQEKISDSMEIQVRLKVLSSVNETYQFSVRTSWGQKGDIINPYHEEKDGILTKSFIFRKRPNMEFKDVVLLADGKEQFFEEKNQLSQTNRESSTECVPAIERSELELILEASAPPSTVSEIIRWVERVNYYIREKTQIGESHSDFQPLTSQTKQETEYIRTAGGLIPKSEWLKRREQERSVREEAQRQREERLLQEKDRDEREAMKLRWRKKHGM